MNYLKKFNLTENRAIPEPLVECSTLKLIGLYCVGLFFVSIATNKILIIITLKYKNQILRHINILTLSTAVLNSIGTLIELPMIASSAFECK